MKLKEEELNLGVFLRRFGTNDLCVEAIKDLKYPDGVYCGECKAVTKFYKKKNRQVYRDSLGHQIAPLSGTIFEKTTTPLQYWFYAIYLMSVTRSGVSAKQLQRTLGVTYKTAWRMFQQIRKLMADDGSGGLLTGEVEVDETFIGGKGQNRRFVWHGNEKPKQIIMGMIARHGKAYFKHIESTGKWALLKQIKDHVDPQARIITDQYGGYMGLPRYGYRHDYVDHGVTFVKDDVHTQNAENVWSIMKRGLYGVYRSVSPKYLQAYVDEYGWRYNNRLAGEKMFSLLLKQIAQVKMIRKQ